MPTNTDWEKIEAEYRAGQLSLREIARQNGITDTAVRKKAKAGGWQRDLADRVRKRAAEMLVRIDGGSHSGSQSSREEETRTELVAARARVEVIRDHRHAIRRGRDLTLRLLDELDTTTSRLGELEELIELDTLGEGSQRRNGMHRAISLPSRAGVIKDLSAAAKNWVTLERQAFGMDENGGVGDEPATKADVRTAIAKLDQGQRDQLRHIAAAIISGPSASDPGT